MLLIALVLAAITGRTELLNETIEVPRSQWRAMRVELRDKPATVEVNFRVSSGRSGVRVVILTDAELKRFEKGERHEVLAQTDFASEGTFRYLVGNPGDYRILLDNRLEGREPAKVELRVALLHHDQSTFVPKLLDPVRRRSVVGISLGGFCLVALLLARKLGPVWRGL
jgi:hypothetical protein